MIPFRIGTRGSMLALAQAAWVKKRLEEEYPGLLVETVLIKTSGDRFLESAIQSIGGKGVFTKEIEEALLAREIDLAVHSMKDLPTDLAPGLTVAAVPEREDPRDALVATAASSLQDLVSGARIGTGSLRRQAQLRHYRPDLSVVPIRGNIDTRLKKLDGGEVDALIMAAAGLQRIDKGKRIAEFISDGVCVSAVAQGALALETRDNDLMREKFSFLHHAGSFAEVGAERAFLKRLGGGCHVPVGARARLAGDELKIVGVVADPDGSFLYRGERSGLAVTAEILGLELAERLLADGAERILKLG
jgi:hydroxymethylbilane synthase